MALGKELGSWSYQIKSTTYIPGPGNSVTVQLNCGGAVLGEMAGKGEGTLTVAVNEPGEKSGTWSWCGAVYLDAGSIVGTRGQGTIEASGKHHWRLKGSVVQSDGRTAAVEAEGDFAAQSFSGKAYEWS